MRITRPNVPLPPDQVYLYDYDDVEVLTAQSVVLLYMVDRAIGEAEWKEAIMSDALGASVAVVKISPVGQYRREAISEDDWRLAEEINREIWQELKRTCDRRPSGYPDFHIFLYSPLPLAFHLGAVIRDRLSLFVYQSNREGHFYLVKKPTQTFNASSEKYWQISNLPVNSPPQKGEVPVAITISLTHKINLADVGAGVVLANEEVRYLDIVELHGRVGSGHNVLGKDVEVYQACEEFRAVTDQIREIWPNRSGLHIFYAGPASLAFLLGQICHLDLHPKFIFYQHEQGYYKPILQFSKEDELPVQREKLDETALKSALRMLGKFRNVYNNLKAEIQEGKLVLPVGIANSSKETAARLLNTSIIEDNELEKNGERPFSFDYSRHKKWTFDAYFMIAFDKAMQLKHFDSNQELDDAIKLFFLHELVHPDQQLTSRNSPNIGRAGLVLEAADYDADVFAFEGVVEWYRQFEPLKLEDIGESKFLAYLIKTALRIMALFDEAEQGGYPLKTIATRRLRRYLIWHFQRVRSEIKEGCTITPTNLRQRPAIEITFLQEQIDRNRFQGVISRDRLHKDERMELVAYFGEKIYRWSGKAGGPHPLDLVEATMKGEAGWEDIAEVFTHLLEDNWGDIVN